MNTANQVRHAIPDKSPDSRNNPRWLKKTATTVGALLMLPTLFLGTKAVCEFIDAGSSQTNAAATAETTAGFLDTRHTIETAGIDAVYIGAVAILGAIARRQKTSQQQIV